VTIRKIDIYEPMRHPQADPRADEILVRTMAKFVEIIPPKSPGPIMNPLHPLHVTVKFGDGIPSSFHGKALLDFEKALRALTGLRAEVFMDAKGDDSKLRSAMTKEQRAKL
jgi:hypothetical protein